jgi:hypothetical protein
MEALDATSTAVDRDIAQRVAALDWGALAAALEAQGHALTAPLLTPRECAALAALDGEDARFRSRIDMARYRFGRGRYGYFAYPLPALVQALRTHLYRRLAPIATRWAGYMGQVERYPAALPEFLARCADQGQTRPTPLLLHYEPGDFNCLHQDRYGAVFFPLQATGFLGRPGVDYTGGEFLLVEQRPRQQSRGTALTPHQGQFLLFPSIHRPVQGARGRLRATLRHGVSTITTGTRSTLGIIFHDAE